MTSALKYSIAASGTAVLAALPCVGWSVHVGQQGYFLNTQRIDNDMNMDIAAVVVSVRVGADNGLVSGEMLGTKFLAQLLAPGLRSSRCPLRPVGQRK